MRPKRDAETLRAVSEHLQYEYWMFYSLAARIAAGGEGDRVVRNAMLESFVIHTRVLIEFLYSDTAWHDTAVAADFFAEPADWLAVRPTMSETLEDARRRVGKDAVHLTYTRLAQTPVTKRWPVAEIADEIGRAMTAFRHNVPAGTLSWIWDRVPE
jgi:hypothetical protein